MRQTCVWVLLVSIVTVETYTLAPFGQRDVLRRAPVSNMLGPQPQPWRQLHSRRQWLCGSSAAVALTGMPLRGHASGGATAGKTTSIPRAKVRYYGRISQVLYAFNGLGKAITGGDAAAIKAAKASFWRDSEEAPVSELKSAGYLLAVAFKIDSKIPPEKIPAVKDYKKMMTDVDKLKAAMATGKAAEAAKAYAASKTSLNAYVTPPCGELHPF
jgi:hypothetical protein